MNSPLISIIIPVYNVEKHIKRCINSIVKQQFNDVEVILVDDGSTDNSPLICDEYSKNYKFINVIHKDNGGLVSARQAGFIKARGKYIASVDSDDYVEDCYFSELFNIIDKYHPDTIYFNFNEDRSGIKKQSILSCREGYFTKKQIEDEIFSYLIHSSKNKYFAPSIWSKVFKREMFLKNCFIDNKITIGEDYSVVVPCIINSESLFVTSKSLYNYCIHNDSMTHNKKPFDIHFPIYLHNQLMKSVDISKFDFEEQSFRRTTRNIFNAFYSQFYSDLPYKDIVKILNEYRKHDIFDTSIENCNFSNIILKLVKTCLKRRFYFLLLFYAKITS